MKLTKNQRIWLTSTVLAFLGLIFVLRVVFPEGGDEWPCCRRGSGVHWFELPQLVLRFSQWH